MIKRRYIKIALIVSSFFLFDACVVSKELIQKTDFPFVIQEVYYQKNIPGIEGQSSYYELSFTVTSLQPNVSIDSVFFKGTKTVLSKWQGKDKIIFSAKINEKSIKKHTYLNTTLKQNEALLIGCELNNKQYFLIDSIIQKADIYLP